MREPLDSHKSPMRRTIFVILSACILVTMGVLLTVGPRRVIGELRWGRFTPAARTFLAAAARLDSLALDSLAVGSEPVHSALVLGRMSGHLAEVSARSVVPVGGGQTGQAVTVQYRTAAPVCSPYGGPDEIQFRFVPTNAGWRVIFIGGEC